MKLLDCMSRFAYSAKALVKSPSVSRLLVLARIRKLGRSAPFNPTPAAVKVYRAVIANKVALIERLPSKYHELAKELVWDSVMRGYDAAGLARHLHERLGIAPERATLIASMQCKMARSVMENAQLIEMGSTEAIWRYDRIRCAIPGHRAFDGKPYELARGTDVDGKRHWPSSEPLCFCTSAATSTLFAEDEDG